MKASIAIAAVLVCAGSALAQNNGDGERLTLVLNGGWTYDELQFEGGFTDGSNIEFTLDGPAYFRITDSFIVGDIWTAVGMGSTEFNGPQAPTLFGGPGEESWLDGEYSHLELLLGPGVYSFPVTGDGAGGLPAGVYYQLESIPAPGAASLVGLAALVVARRRR